MPNRSYKLVSPILVITALIVFISALDSQAREQSVSSTNEQNLNIKNSQQTVKVGNNKVHNYENNELYFSPMQVTQLIYNIKSKKSRASRKPTWQEMQVKNRIKEIFISAFANRNTDEAEHYIKRLYNIIESLNPKYIATERVFKAAFAGIEEDIQIVPPEAEYDNEGKFQLSVPQQLDKMEKRFYEVFDMDPDFLEKLLKEDDRGLNPENLAFKQLILCLYKSKCGAKMLNSNSAAPTKDQVRTANQAQVAPNKPMKVKKPAPSAATPVSPGLAEAPRAKEYRRNASGRTSRVMPASPDGAELGRESIEFMESSQEQQHRHHQQPKRRPTNWQRSQASLQEPGNPSLAKLNKSKQPIFRPSEVESRSAEEQGYAYKANNADREADETVNFLYELDLIPKEFQVPKS